MAKQRTSHAFEIERSVPFQISQLSTALNAQAKKIISRHSDLNLAQWRILHLLCWKVADTTTGVRKAAGIDKSQFSKSVRCLADLGLIKMLSFEKDRRQHQLVVTARGRKLHARISPEIDARRAHLMSAISVKEQQMLFSVIKRLEAAADKTDFRNMDEQRVDEPGKAVA